MTAFFEGVMLGIVTMSSTCILGWFSYFVSIAASTENPAFQI